MDSSAELGDFLAHYGVKGMRWGVRRSGTVKTARKTKSANSIEKARRKEMVKNRRLLDEKDIDKAIERLSKEKKLKDLTAADVAPGRRVVSAIMSDSGQKIARTVVAGAGMYLVVKAFERKFRPDSEGKDHSLISAIKKGGYIKK